MDDYIPLKSEQERRSRIVEHIRILNIIFLCGAAMLVYVPYIHVILGLNRGAVIPQPSEPPCQNQCAVNVPLSSVQEFNSFSLDPSHVVFVHFRVYNLSLQSSCTTDILDPLNLLWGDSIGAPVLSLDLGFRFYSFTTLSRVVRHMKVKIENQSLSCLPNLNHSCLTATLAKSFLGTVTKERGVLCYAVNDTNTVNYRCCKGNVRTKQVECDIPAALSPEMTAIFKVTAIAAAFAILYFPAIFNIIPDKENSNTLSSNIQVHNPLFQIGIRAIQALQNASDNYKLDTLRKLFLSAALPILFYVDLGLTYHIKTYDIPQMFNDCVKEFWAQTKTTLTTYGFLLLWLIMLVYVFVVLLFSLLPRREKLNFSYSSNKYYAEVVNSMIEEEKDLKVNWSTPWEATKNCYYWLKSCCYETWQEQGSFCCKTLMLLVNFVLLMLSAVASICIFIAYTLYTSPSGQTVRPVMNCALIYNVWIWDCLSISTSTQRRGWKWHIFVSLLLSVLEIFILALVMIFMVSLILLSRFIVYLWIGLVASKDYYFPRIAFIFVSMYYTWDCVSSVAGRYQKLLQQTFEKCKVLQEQQPNARKPLIFDDKGRPRISSQLFQNVIDEILPRSEAYTNMVLKLTMIVLFLCLTHYSILVFGISNLDQFTQALVVFLTALVPKLIEIFGERSDSRQLWELEKACQVEKIVKDFLSQNDNNGARENQITVSQDENQPSSTDVHFDVHVQINND